VAAGGIDIRLGHDVHRHTAELGCWPGEKPWRRGIMTEVVTAFTDFWFDNFPRRRIYAESFANNPASARVLENVGFVFEGRLKNNAVKDGELLDSLLYAKTSWKFDVVMPALNAGALPRGVTVHRAYFAVNLVIALGFAKTGIGVCLFCVYAARKRCPRCNENYKQTNNHSPMSISDTASQGIHRISDCGGSVSDAELISCRKD
jgi:hypothetical protein